jgi:hypothetical protein
MGSIEKRSKGATKECSHKGARKNEKLKRRGD